MNIEYCCSDFNSALAFIDIPQFVVAAIRKPHARRRRRLQCGRLPQQQQ
jgi:hypothetical protein